MGQTGLLNPILCPTLSLRGNNAHHHSSFRLESLLHNLQNFFEHATAAADEDSIRVG